MGFSTLNGSPWVLCGPFIKSTSQKLTFPPISLLLRYISYPRTETNIFPKDLNLSQLVQLQTQDPHWGAFAQRILDGGRPTPRQGAKSDQAHPPIHPTKYAGNLQVSPRDW